MATKNKQVIQLTLTDEPSANSDPDALKEVSIDEAVRDWLKLGADDVRLTELLVQRMKASGAYVFKRKDEILEQAVAELLRRIHANEPVQFDEMIPGKRSIKFELRVKLPEGKLLAELLGLNEKEPAVIPNPVAKIVGSGQTVVHDGQSFQRPVEEKPAESPQRPGRIIRPQSRQNPETFTPEQIASAWHAALQMPKTMLMDRPEFKAKLIQVTELLLGVNAQGDGKAGKVFLPLLQAKESGISEAEMKQAVMQISSAVDEKQRSSHQPVRTPIITSTPAPASVPVPAPVAPPKVQPEPPPQNVLEAVIGARQWLAAAQHLRNLHSPPQQMQELAWKIFRSAFADETIRSDHFKAVADITLRYVALMPTPGEPLDTLLNVWGVDAKHLRLIALLITSGRLSNDALQQLGYALEIGMATMKAAEAAKQVEQNLLRLSELTSAKFILVPKHVEKTEMVRRPQLWRARIGSAINQFFARWRTNAE